MRRRALLVPALLALSSCDGGSAAASGDASPDAADGSPGTLADAAGSPDGGPGGDDAPDQAEVGPDVPDVPAAPDRAPALVDPIILTGPKTPGGIDIQPAVALTAAGEVVLAWTGSATTDDLGIHYAVLAADGSLTVDATRLDTDRKGLRNEPSICALAGGGYVVAWSQDSKEAVADNLRIRFRRIDPEGAPVEAEDVRVLTEVPGNHWLARVACDPDGGFAIAGVRPDTDGVTFGAFVQRYDADGQPTGPAIPVNTKPDGGQTYPAIGLGSGGLAVVAWDDATLGESDLQRVLVRRLTTPPTPTPTLSAADHPAATAAVSVTPTTGAFLTAATVNSKSLIVKHFAAGSDKGSPVDLPASTAVAYNPALAPVGSSGLHVLLHLEGTGANAAAKLLVVGDEVVEGPVTVGQGKLPPYRPTVTWRAGRIAAAWTESLNGGYETRVALFGP
jgi:hypothetical protein